MERKILNIEKNLEFVQTINQIPGIINSLDKLEKELETRDLWDIPFDYVPGSRTKNKPGNPYKTNKVLTLEDIAIDKEDNNWCIMIFNYNYHDEQAGTFDHPFRRPGNYQDIVLGAYHPREIFGNIFFRPLVRYVSELHLGEYEFCISEFSANDNKAKFKVDLTEKKENNPPNIQIFAGVYNIFSRDKGAITIRWQDDEDGLVKIELPYPFFM